MPDDVAPLPRPTLNWRRRLADRANRHAMALWLTLFAVLAIVFGVRQRGEIADIRDTLVGATPHWVALALVIQASVVVMIAASYSVVLRRLGQRLRLATLVAIHLQRVVAGTLTPLGGPASVYVYVRNLNRRGVSTDDALLSITVRTFATYAAFLLLLAPALAISHPARATVLGSAALVALFVIGAVGIWHASRPGVPPARLLPKRAARFLERVREHGMGARDLAKPFLLGLIMYLAMACTLDVSLRAVGAPASARVALVGFVVGTLFTIMAPFFSGIGIVELSIVVALTAQGVNEHNAIAAVLLYRFADVWFPLILGLLVEVGRRPTLRRLFRGGGRQ